MTDPLARAVEILTDEAIDEWSSWRSSHDCGVSWEGDRCDGWLLLSRMLARRLPVTALRRAWSVRDGEPHGPLWQIVLSLEDTDAADD